MMLKYILVNKGKKYDPICHKNIFGIIFLFCKNNFPDNNVNT